MSSSDEVGLGLFEMVVEVSGEERSGEDWGNVGFGGFKGD
jgi:hypothetical protein